MNNYDDFVDLGGETIAFKQSHGIIDDPLMGELYEPFFHASGHTQEEICRKIIKQLRKAASRIEKGLEENHK